MLAERKNPTSVMMNVAHYVGGITKTVGDTVTSSVESVLNNPNIIMDTANNLASTIIDGATYFPAVALDEVAHERSYGAKSRTNQRIDNALDEISESINQLGKDYVKHQKAIDTGDFEAAGKLLVDMWHR